MAAFVGKHNIEVDRHKRAPADTHVDKFVNVTNLRWDGSLKEHLQNASSVALDANQAAAEVGEAAPRLGRGKGGRGKGDITLN